MSTYVDEELDFEPEDCLVDELDHVIEDVPSPEELKNVDIITIDSDTDDKTNYNDYICDTWTNSKNYKYSYTEEFVCRSDDAVLLDSTDCNTDDEETENDEENTKISPRNFKDCNINIEFVDDYENIVIRAVNNVPPRAESVSDTDSYEESTNTTVQSTEPVIKRLFFTRKPWTQNIILDLCKIKSTDDIFQPFSWNFDKPETPNTPPRPASDTISLHPESEMPMEVEETPQGDKIVVQPPGKADYLRNWIQNTTVATRIDVTNVPNEFCGLCYHHFFNSNCTKDNCTRKHYLGSYFTCRLSSTEPARLLEIYHWTKDVLPFRVQAIESFIVAFTVRNSLKGLVQIIEDSFETDLLNEKSIVSKVFFEMKERNHIPIQECVKSIVLGIGTYKYPNLADIILEIISDWPVYEGDWDCINLLSYGRDTQFNSIPIINIISKCANEYPVNMSLLRNIYNLVDKRLIEIKNIPKELEIVLKHALQSNSPLIIESNQQNLIETRSLSPINQYNQYLNNDYPNSSIESGSTSGMNVKPNRNDEKHNVNYCEIVDFGQRKYNSGFVLNKSVHNFYPNYKETVITEMNSHDVQILNNVIQKCDGERFLQLLEEYKDVHSVKSFITLTINTLKHCKPLYIRYQNLLTSIKEKLPNFMTIRTHKAIFEVITLNLLYELEKRGMYKEAAMLLCEFNDWDNLLSSLILNRRRSQMGRYIYLSKIFIKTNDYSLAYRVFMNQRLKLLEEPTRWPYGFDSKDLERRNKVLKKFFEEGYHYDVVAVTNLYRIIFTCANVYGYDFCKHLDSMFEHLINEKMINALKLLYNDIDHYCTRIKRSNLRAFNILIVNYISEDEQFSLFEKCVQLNIYKGFEGTESLIEIRTDMFDKEIELIFKYFLSKLKQPFSREISVNILLPFNEHNSELNLFKNSLRSVLDVNEVIKQILNNLQLEIIRQEINLIKFRFKHRTSW